MLFEPQNSSSSARCIRPSAPCPSATCATPSARSPAASLPLAVPGVTSVCSTRAPAQIQSERQIARRCFNCRCYADAIGWNRIRDGLLDCFKALCSLLPLWQRCSTPLRIRNKCRLYGNIRAFSSRLLVLSASAFMSLTRLLQTCDCPCPQTFKPWPASPLLLAMTLQATHFRDLNVTLLSCR
jgi:hypothetical protein